MLNSISYREKKLKLETVKKIYLALNAKNFGGVLDMPRILFSRSLDFHGQHSGDILEFNLEGIKGYFAVRELVFHEMVHQYVDEFLQLEDTNDHGKIFVKTYNKFCTSNMTLDTDYLYGDWHDEK
jgi:hypothetical protein